MTEKTISKKANSKLPVAGYSWNNVSGTITPDFSFKEILSMVESDPVANGSIQQFVDKCMEGGYSIIKRDSKTYDKSFEDKLRYEYYFDTKVLRRVFKAGKLFNNVFIEVVRNKNGGVSDLNVLDSSLIQPITKPNGDVIRYKAKYNDPKTGKPIYWNVNDVVWVKFGNVDNGFANTDIKSLVTTLQQKYFIQRFVSWAWKTGQYRVIHNFRNSDDRVVEAFITYNSKVENDYTKPFIGGGEYQRLMLRDMKEINDLEEYLKYLDNQIVIALRVPPIDVGIPDASGRSNADAQSNSFNTHVKAWRKVVADSINELFVKMVHGNNAIVFAPTDRFHEEMVLKNVQLMKSINFKEEVIKEYLMDNGLVFTSGSLFEEVEVNNVDNPRNLDQMPSRIGKAGGEANDKVGTGQQATTKEEQLVKKSSPGVIIRGGDY